MTPRWIQIAHHLPDRTRLRTPVLRKDQAACERVADVLATISGVRQVAVRPYTGSILIEHDPGTSVDAMVAEARRVLAIAQVLAPGERPPIDQQVPAFSSLARKLVAAVLEIDRDIRRGTDGTVDLGTLATLGMIGGGAAEVAATGKLPLPPWFNLAWWAFRMFTTTEREEIDVERQNGHPHAAGNTT